MLARKLERGKTQDKKWEDSGNTVKGEGEKREASGNENINIQRGFY